MLGFMISVYRQAHPDDRLTPAPDTEERGLQLARWTGDLFSLRWIKELCQTGDAIQHRYNGYPMLYTARCGLVRPVAQHVPPNSHEKQFEVFGRRDLDPALLECLVDEWLIVEAWDLS